MVSGKVETGGEKATGMYFNICSHFTLCREGKRSSARKGILEVIELHASGSGGMALEELVRSGEISGVLDITALKWSTIFLGGILQCWAK